MRSSIICNFYFLQSKIKFKNLFFSIYLFNAQNLFSISEKIFFSLLSLFRGVIGGSWFII